MISDDSPTKTESKSTSKESAASSDGAANYSRGESQKAVTSAYRDNWNLIFGKKTTAKKAASNAARSKARTATRAKSKTARVATKAKAAKSAKGSGRR